MLDSHSLSPSACLSPLLVTHPWFPDSSFVAVSARLHIKEVLVGSKGDAHYKEGRLRGMSHLTEDSLMEPFKQQDPRPLKKEHFNVLEGQPL